jgi:hypothetical protein
MSTARLPAAHRSLIASRASLTRWAGLNSPEARRAATAPATAGRRRKWELKADPDGVLPPAEREAAVERLKRAHYQLMALRSAQARAARRPKAN